MTILLDCDVFLERCAKGSSDAYDALKELLCRLESVDSRCDARIFLGQLSKFVLDEYDEEECLQKYFFCFQRLALEDTQELILLQLPSIFTPEQWSFTFYEGLSRYHSNEFHGQTLSELGCGNGWISIALASQFDVHKIYGLDINPRAITCAKINLYINGLDDNGLELASGILQKVEFGVSDLLEYCKLRNVTLDKVIGCIPQVLSPDPAIAAKIIPENSDDVFLYSLSNYCSKQGYIEDQFGLGLIARALEESIEVIKPNGKVILNLGGRPGQAVLERLFERRGFSVKALWKTHVIQAYDTDIDSLVQIETQTPHRFEFFTKSSMDAPICAETAKRYALAGGEILHALTVYEAKCDHLADIKKMFRLLKSSEYENAKNALDLSYCDKSNLEEKAHFLSFFATWLSGQSFFAYEDTEGLLSFRKQIALFLKNYWSVPLTASNIFVTPGRKAAIALICRLMSAKLVLVSRSLVDPDFTCVEIPERADIACEMIERLKPSLAIVSLADFETRSSNVVDHLISVAHANKCFLIIDISNQFELSSQPQHCGPLDYLRQHQLPDNVVLCCGLVKNKLYQDMEICFFVHASQVFLQHMSAGAELTFSRTPLVAQIFYQRLFADLNSFHMPKRHLGATPVLSNHTSQASVFLSTLPLGHPAVRTAPATNVIRLDYGENSLSNVTKIKPYLMQAFVSQQVVSHELQLTTQIQILLERRFGIAQVQLCMTQGCAPAFYMLAEACRNAKRTMVFPQGCYGMFHAAAQFADCTMRLIPTHRNDLFKLSVSELRQNLKQNDWLYLNAPLVNPMGCLYSEQELVEIFEFARTQNVTIILDTIFSGLEFDTQKFGSKFKEAFDNSDCYVIGGIAKEFAAGGLRFGFVGHKERSRLQIFQGHLSQQPHRTTMEMASILYQSWNENEPALIDQLHNQSKELSQRSEALQCLLTRNGWDVVPSAGGLFMVASPAGLLGKTATVSGNKVTIGFDNISHCLEHGAGVLVNSPEWTGLPGFLRFVLSVTSSDFKIALERLDLFHKNLEYT